jgi:hypothetical protein
VRPTARFNAGPELLLANCCLLVDLAARRLQASREQVIIQTLIEVLPRVFSVQVLSSGWVVNTKRWADAHFFFGKSF